MGRARLPSRAAQGPASLQGVGVKSPSSALYLLCGLPEVTQLSLTSFIRGIDDTVCYECIAVCYEHRMGSLCM